MIRISYGDYQLQTIPPGMILEVPYKPIEKQIRKGPVFKSTNRPSNHRSSNKRSDTNEPKASPVQWIRNL